MEKASTIELAEGTPAMVKHPLLAERERGNQERCEHMAARRQEAMAAVWHGKDLTMAQAVAADMDWAFVSEMATRNATRNSIKRILTASVWGVIPTPLWLASHGWEVETVCEICGRTKAYHGWV